MRQQGRYLRFRHVFPELFVPGMQGRRGLLRLRWFLLQRIDFRPIWTLGALAGLSGVLLTVSLFFVQAVPQLAIAARIAPPATPATEPPAVKPIEPSPVPPFPLFPSATPVESPLPQLQTGLQALWTRLTMPGLWEDRQRTTVVSRPQAMEGDAYLRLPSSEQWARRIWRDLPSAATFTPYREPAGLNGWEPIASTVSYSDLVPRSGGVSTEARPGALIEKLVPEKPKSGEPLKYWLIVTNPGRQPLPEVTLFEAVDVSRVTAVNPPARVDIHGLRWRLGSLASGEQRRLSVSVWTDGVPEVAATSEIQVTDRVAMAVQVAGAAPSPPPQQQPPPRIEVPTLPRSPGLPAFPSQQELPPFPSLEPPAATPEPVRPTPQAPPQVPAFPTLPAFPDLPNTTPNPPPATPGRPILKLRAESPPAVAVGQDATTWYEIENVGTAPAHDIVLLVNLPEGLEHFDGSPSVRYTLKQLNPGERQRAQLITRVRKHGVFAVNGELKSGDQREPSLVQFIAPADSGPADLPEESDPDETRSLPCRCCDAGQRLLSSR